MGKSNFLWIDRIDCNNNNVQCCVNMDNVTYVDFSGRIAMISFYDGEDYIETPDVELLKRYLSNDQRGI